MSAGILRRSGESDQKWRGRGRLVGVSAAILTLALLLLSACASGESGEPAATTSTVGGGAGAVDATTGGTASGRVVGGPGPQGVGTVVATSEGSGTYVDITPDELAAMLENKDFLLINTHIPYEGEIEQTDLFLPYDQAAEQLDRLPPEKDAKIVVYCRSDRMSRISIEEWVKAGYTDLYNLDGGFVAWEAAGYELLHK